MARGIPKVREWRVTMEGGVKWRVLAPTKYLAKLNLRHGPGVNGWGPIEKIGAVKSTGQREMVVREV